MVAQYWLATEVGDGHSGRHVCARAKAKRAATERTFRRNGNMNGLGTRLREERERLGMTQRVFGDIGGVEPNAQGKYESGERTPRADYLAALAASGVDALYVLNGVRTPAPLDCLSADETGLLSALRRLPEADKAALQHLLLRLAGEAVGGESAWQPRQNRQTFLTEALR